MRARTLLYGLICWAALGVVPRGAKAQALRYHLTLDGARAVRGHQAHEFGWGMGVFGAAEMPLFPQLGLELEAGGLFLSQGHAPKDPGIKRERAASGTSVALALRAYPFAKEDAAARSALSGLWLSAGGGGTSTKDLLGPTLNFNLGYDVQLTSQFGIGPTLGYVHIFQPNSALRPDDASIFLVGVHAAYNSQDVLAASDRDHDGIGDDIDRCPDHAEDVDGFEDQDGCPDLDNDQDGLPDAIDKCPASPEDKDGFEDADGCPELDNDRDEIPDAKDKCPLEAEDKDGFEDADGCPEPDNDQDGIADATDQCPNEAETVNGYADADGCPDDQDIRVTGDLIVLDDRVHFWKNSHLIRRESLPLLARIAKLIIAHPEYIHIEVEGHTDGRGPDSYNKPLSERRAEQVMKVLIDNRVEMWRLSFRGFGEEQPLVEGTSEYAMWMNRRVEFRITRRPLPETQPVATPATQVPAASAPEGKPAAGAPDGPAEPAPPVALPAAAGAAAAEAPAPAGTDEKSPEMSEETPEGDHPEAAPEGDHSGVNHPEGEHP
ncbi:MAG: OmpA family protein [Polyangiaceae bacterium]|nr:OmpA family protein [Polyangiaceae bacterium]